MEAYAKDRMKVLEDLQTNRRGLSFDDVAKRQLKYGRNQITTAKPHSMLRRFAQQFNNVLIYILIVSATISAALSHWADASVIFAVIIINALIGFIQEGKAEQALAAIRKLLSPQCKVIRSDITQLIPATDLVPGDIVLIQSGDILAADLRLIEAKNLQVLESILTGESNAVNKSADPVAENTPLSERSSMAYSGTSVTHGSGTGVVVNTGINTEIGKISSMLKAVSKIKTPLLIKMETFARWLTVIIVVIATVTFLFGSLLQHYSTQQMFMAAVSLAVAAIPEGLPAIMTISLAIGVTRMVKHQTIIRKLPAIETMGSVTVICTDKTGTLTRNELKVIDSKTDHQDRLLLACVLCNEASDMGNPIDRALLKFAQLDAIITRQENPRLDLLSFESEQQLMASLHQIGSTKTLLVKGAPEKLLELCPNDDRAYWKKITNTLAAKGQRLIAFAQNENFPDDTISLNDINNLQMLGIVGLIDPPRDKAKLAIEECHNAGIDVKMITGDHVLTAQAIADDIGMGNELLTLTGPEIDQLSDQELAQHVEKTAIFARATPQHKLRIVTALQSCNHVVAMTGDGVNDAPALKRANIGIAMGIKGTEVSKEVADIILVDDNFATIRDAIREGRTVYDNLKKAILYILPNSFAEAFMIIIAILLGITLPITPLQILWINMVTTVTLDISLAFEPSEKNIMKLPPRPPSEKLLGGYLLWRIFFVSLIMVAGTFALFYYHLDQDLATARSLVVNAFVAAEIVYLLNCRKLHSTTLSYGGFFGSPAVLICIAIVCALQAIMTYIPIVADFFEVAPLHANHWAMIAGFALILFFLIEFESWVIGKIKNPPPAGGR